MLGTAPLGGWKVPYDGPVDTNFAISVDRHMCSARIGRRFFGVLGRVGFIPRKASDEDRRLKKEARAVVGQGLLMSTTREDVLRTNIIETLRMRRGSCKDPGRGGLLVS